MLHLVLVVFTAQINAHKQILYFLVDFFVHFYIILRNENTIVSFCTWYTMPHHVLRAPDNTLIYILLSDPSRYHLRRNKNHYNGVVTVSGCTWYTMPYQVLCASDMTFLYVWVRTTGQKTIMLAVRNVFSQSHTADVWYWGCHSPSIGGHVVEQHHHLANTARRQFITMQDASKYPVAPSAFNLNRVFFPKFLPLCCPVLEHPLIPMLGGRMHIIFKFKSVRSLNCTFRGRLKKRLTKKFVDSGRNLF